MVLAIGTMLLPGSMHSPAVPGALGFRLKSGEESKLLLFCMAIGIAAMLVIIQRTALWLMRRFNNGGDARAEANHSSNQSMPR